MRRTLLFLLAALLTPGAVEAQTKAVTVVIVRHAETVPDGSRDPALSEAGLARARALADAVSGADLRAVLVTQYQRTRQTGEVAAADAGAPLVVVAAEAALEAHVRAVVARVFADYAGGTVLIVGHSNTVPAIVEGFTGINPGEISHDDHANLFVVTSDGRPGSGRLVRARYGA